MIRRLLTRLGLMKEEPPTIEARQEAKRKAQALQQQKESRQSVEILKAQAEVLVRSSQK